MSTDFVTEITNSAFIFRFVLVISVLIIGLVIIGKANSWLRTIQRPEWGPMANVNAVIWSFLFILYAWCWYRAIITSSTLSPLLLNGLFAGGLFLFLLWVIIFYQNQEPVTARWIILLLALIVGVQAYLFGFRLNSATPFVCSSIIFIWIAFTFYWNLQIDGSLTQTASLRTRSKNRQMVTPMD
jgi:tryptophan-rich sensory protein